MTTRHKLRPITEMEPVSGVADTPIPHDEFLPLVAAYIARGDAPTDAAENAVAAWRAIAAHHWQTAIKEVKAADGWSITVEDVEINRWRPIVRTRRYILGY
jgi:hypothetical protein